MHLIRNNWLTELLVPLEDIQYIVRLSFSYSILMLGWLDLPGLSSCDPDDALAVSAGLPNDPVQHARKRRDALPYVLRATHQPVRIT
jgi:hypothetical protein